MIHAVSDRQAKRASGAAARGAGRDPVDGLHERIQHSRLVILPRLKHSLLVEAPELLGRELLAFLNA